MDLKQLRYFCSIYDNKSLSAAADAERIAVSALSYHLANLEAEIGAPLFNRKSRGLEATAAGERLYFHARSILKTVEVAKRDLSTFRDNVSGEVSLAMAYSAIQAIGVQLAKVVVEDYPNLQLNMIESLSSTTLLHLSSADADLGLAYNPPLTSTFKATPILEEDLVLIGKREIIGSGSEPVTVSELLDFKIIMLRQGMAARALLDHHKTLEQIYATSQLQMNSVHAISGAVREGLGCTIGTTLFMGDEIKSGRLHWRPIISPTLTRTLYLCEQTDRPPTIALETIRDLIRDLMVRAVKDGIWPARLVEAE